MTPDPDHDDPFKHGDIKSNTVRPLELPSLTGYLQNRFSSFTRQTDKANNTDSLHMEGSGHLEIDFGGETEVDLHSTGDELRLVVQSASGEHEASMSAVLDANSARKLGEELVHRSNQLDESD